MALAKAYIWQVWNVLIMQKHLMDDEFEATEEGSGQGSVCSPIISCIYMHYVLIWWFREVVTPMLKGYAGLVVYADDCAPRRRKLVT